MLKRFIAPLILAGVVLLCGTNARADVFGDPQIINDFTWLGANNPQEAAMIYDSTNGATGPGSAGLLFTTSNPNASMGDDIAYTPPGAGANRFVNRINVGFVVPANVAVPDVDMLVTFYDLEDPAAMGATPALRLPLGTSRINIGSFTPNAANRGFVTGLTDVSADNIFLPDDLGGISVQFVTAGTNNILTGTTITPGFSVGTVSPGFNNLATFYADGFAPNPLDGIYSGGERVGFGGANASNNKLWLQIEGEVPEPASLGLLAVGGVLALRRRR